MVERLWGRLTDLFAPRFDAKAATTLVLAPRRLESRRMLDAGAAALAMATLEASGEFVQAGEDYAALNEASDESLIAAAAAAPPIDFLPTTGIDEDGVATLEFFYDVPGATFIEIDWGDESGVETFVATPGSNFFGTTHQYYDDDPTDTEVDDMPVNVRILREGEPVEGDTTIEVSNVAPTNVVVTATDSILENGVADLEVTFDDVGTLDSHVVEVDWGDGDVETFNLSVGERYLGTTHTYLDDDPSVTTFDEYEVKVRVLDDDGGIGTGNVEKVVVSNVAPSNVQITSISPAILDEHGVVELELTFDDPGTLDVHQVEVDWGDGEVETFNLSVGERFLSTTHQYFDDNPTNTPFDKYQIKVRVLDDDGGIGTAETEVEVRDVAPLNVAVAPLASVIAEGSAANLTVTFDDPGTLDTHTFEVDWGDGQVTAGAVAAGMHTFAASHTYADNGNYNVTVRVKDDDTKIGVGTTKIEVTNVPPKLDPIGSKSIAEGALLSIPDIGKFTDPGFDNPLNPIPGGELTETFTYVINWGDGTANSAGAATVDAVGSPGTPTSGSFDGSHTYADNGSYLVTVTVTDDDGDSAVQTFTVTVSNVAPTLDPIGDKSIAEGSLLSIPDIGKFTDPGFDNPLNPVPGGELVETFTYIINWGDGTANSAGAATVDQVGSPGVLTSGSFDGSHTYADNGSYLVTVTVTDDDGDSAVQTFTVTVSNASPTLDPIGDKSIAEGALLSIPDIGKFTDPGFDNPLNPVPGGELVETFTYVISWGDGTANSVGAATVDAVGSPGVLTSGSFDGSHTYADNGSYLVTVTVTDDDGDSAVQTFTVTVSNVAPTLDPIGNKSIAEGALLSIPDIGKFTDPGFDNPLNPVRGGELVETFTYVINWGDGTANSAGAATVDQVGSPGVLTSGSFDGSHTYADNGTYTVTVTVTDDDGDSAVQTFTVTVSNVAPTLDPIGDKSISEGSLLSMPDIGKFTDPGFDNPLNPMPGGELVETFTYVINWGDGTTNSAGAATVDQVGSPGVLTSGSFDGSHTYADNGSYLVTVTVTDDDGDSAVQTFTVTVSNVAPSLDPISNKSIAEGSLLSLPNVGQFTDPGFDNPLNPVPGGELVETFTYVINWGDGTANSVGAATIDAVGSPGTLTSGSFDGSHTFADNGTYTVTVTVTDDDGDSAVQTFTVTVSNVAPTLDPISNKSIAEGSLLSLPNVGQFTDPGFDNPLNPVPGGELVETFTYVINWGDGTTDSAGAATVDLVGSPGVLTSGSFDSSHTFADNGTYTVTVTVTDDDGDSAVQTFTVTVSNVAPTLNAITDKAIAEGSLLSLPNVGQFTDPGFDNPLNPVPGGELVETFTYVINWGDGTANSAGAATVDLIGSPGVLTSGSFDSSHTFADNGTYLVTVTVTDDDGDSAVQTFNVTVSNVAPTLTLTIDEALITPIDEGETVTVNFTGLFSDPGFDNPLNPVPGGELAESFEYDIDWGDGHKTARMSLADLTSTPLGPSTGVIDQAFSHQYVDSDLDGVKDARYTVTVTVYDDDGGSHAQTFEVIVYNVNPTLEPITATSVNNKGETTLTITFDDPGAPIVETFEILIDWGDKLTEADPLERFVIELDYDGVTPETFEFLHTYTGPPNPQNPAEDIVITVKIRDDDFGTATTRPDADPLTIDGQSNIESVAITNPGIGGLPFRIDTTPQIALLTLPERPVNAAVVAATNVVATDSSNDEVSGSAGESRAASERFFELRIIEPDGSPGKRFRLPSQVLSNLSALFRNLPDNHYAIYLVQPETDVSRLVIDVYVRNGKLIDPGDDSEGGRDAPPTDEAPAVNQAIEAIEGAPEKDAAADPVEAPATEGEPLGMLLPSSSSIRYRQSLATAAIGLCATGAWRRHVEQTLAKAKPQDWKKLRTAGHRSKRKPR